MSEPLGISLDIPGIWYDMYTRLIPGSIFVGFLKYNEIITNIIPSTGVTPHMLRHSSATYYANRLKNPYKLCYRYGWTIASNMVNRYLDRDGILEEETPSVVKVDEISAAQKLNQGLREELSLVRESYSKLNEQFEKIKAESDGVQTGKGLMKILMGLAKKQKEMSEALQQITGKKFDVVLPPLPAEDQSTFRGCGVVNSRSASRKAEMS